MRYAEPLIIPMREDLTRHGIDETRTPEQVDRALAGNSTVLVVVNSVCGCAAAKARPAVVHSLQNAIVPDKTITVFAGADIEAVAHVRSLAPEFPPSSPSAILFRDRKPVFMLHRSQIEGRQPFEIAADLKKAFETHCAEPSNSRRRTGL